MHWRIERYSAEGFLQEVSGPYSFKAIGSTNYCLQMFKGNGNSFYFLLWATANFEILSARASAPSVVCCLTAPIH